MTEVIEESGSLDKIEQLQYHENTEIYDSVFQMLEEYFCDDDEAQPAEAEVAANGALTLNAAAVNEGAAGTSAGFAF